MNRTRFAQYLAAVLFFLPAGAQAVSLSHGIQLLPISVEDCVQRGARALQAEGYGPVAPTNLMAGFKGAHGVYLVCSARPDGVTQVNIFVATDGVTDGNIPGVERVRLQERMWPTGAPPAPTPVPVAPVGPCQNFSGVWSMSGFGDATLFVDGGGRLSGTYTNGGGRIDGTVGGGSLNGTWTQPGRTGGVQARLQPGGQAFSCEWSEGGRIAGNCNASCKAGVMGQGLPMAGGFAGLWETNYGTVTLTVVGNQVTGDYTSPPGRIQATLSGNVIDGQWLQPGRQGRVRFELDPDGRSFNGGWWEGNSFGGAWNGKRR